MPASRGPDVPENPYAPPRSATAEPRGVRIGRAPLAAIAIGVAVSSTWAVYLDLRLRGSVGATSLKMVVATVVLWGGVTALLISRVSWARVTARVLAVVMIIGTIYSARQGGSLAFYAVLVLRALVFAMVFLLLRARSDATRAAVTE